MILHNHLLDQPWHAHIDQIQVDYEEAANAVGATTGHAFRLRLGKILKKIKDAGGGMKGGSIPPTATKETPTRKRKAATAVDGTTPTLTPTPKKARKTKGKTGATTADEPVSKGAATAVEEYIGEVAVKQEGPAEDHQELSDYASF